MNQNNKLNVNVQIISLGCDKNLCDSEEMLGIINEYGYSIVSNEIEADVIVINTCSFIKDAMEESINTILEIAEHKKNRLKYLIVTGCLSQRYKDEILDEIPEIDACIGISSIDKIASVINDLYNKDNSNSNVNVYDDINLLPEFSTNKVITSSTFMGYIKIAEGCNKSCTYCIIPKLRGCYRSVPLEKILSQAEHMAKNGIKEIILVAQETTSYGIDLYKKKIIHELIQKISLIEDIKWIRILYCYPEEITQELILEFKNNEKLCKYIDMPIQHSEDEILKNMGRRTNKESIKNVINNLRKEVPGIAIRTTFISGFPGETEEHHNNLLEFIDEMEFDRLGVFTYSREEGTPAYFYNNQIDDQIAIDRRNEIMELQQEISKEKNSNMINLEIDVIIEGYIPDEDVYVGRSYKDAPSIDSFVFVKSDYEIISGSIIKVVITEFSEYDLIGRVK